MTEKNLEFDHEPRISELFSRSFELAWKNYAAVLPIFVAAGIANAVILTLISNATPSMAVPQNVQNLPSSQLLSLAGQTFTALGYLMSGFLVSWLILFFAAGVGVWKLHQKLGASEEPIKLNYTSLAGTVILSVIIMWLGLFLFVIGAIVFGIIFYLSLSASVLEKRSPLSAMGRSRQLVSKHWMRTFFIMGGAVAFAYLVSNLIGGVASFFIASTFLSNIVFSLVQNFILALAFPVVSASMLLLYYASQTKQETATKAPPSPYDSMKPQPLWSPANLSPRFCRNCGFEVTLDEKFCHNCGTQQNS
ncbi:MAG: zinc ribbon domain-containing protein [Nitrososphaerales archaeon]